MFDGGMPPANIEAEQCLIACVFANNDRYEAIAGTIQPDHFADATHAKIFEAIEKLIERGDSANAISLKRYFEQDRALDQVGGAEYLSLLNRFPVSDDPKNYSDIIVDAYKRRELQDLGRDLMGRAGDADVDESADDIIAMASDELEILSNTASIGKGAVPVSETLPDLLTALEGYWAGKDLDGVFTGMHDLDALMGPMLPGDLVVLGGRPSMGKTALALNISRNIARSGLPVPFFSQEMKTMSLNERLISGIARISTSAMKSKNLNQHDQERLAECIFDARELPLVIDETAAHKMPAIVAQCRRVKRNMGVGLIVIDHLGLLSPIDMREQKYLQVGRLVKAAKKLAMDLQVPVMLLSQLSRAVESRENKRPLLSDLRDSGEIEQDADKVLFCYRHEYYQEKTKPDKETEPDKYRIWLEESEPHFGMGEVIVAKNRTGGKVGSVPMRFVGEFTSWEDR